MMLYRTCWVSLMIFQGRVGLYLNIRHVSGFIPNVYSVFFLIYWSVLLLFLSRSHIGKAILSQPACVSKLLSLLLDQRPSPKLVLIILQLCRAALPLMSVEDCGNVALPSWSYSINTLDSEQPDANDPASRIAALLLAKLADYVVPGLSCLPRSKNLCVCFFLN